MQRKRSREEQLIIKKVNLQLLMRLQKSETERSKEIEFGLSESDDKPIAKKQPSVQSNTQKVYFDMKNQNIKTEFEIKQHCATQARRNNNLNPQYQKPELAKTQSTQGMQYRQHRIKTENFKILDTKDLLVNADTPHSRIDFYWTEDMSSKALNSTTSDRKDKQKNPTQKDDTRKSYNTVSPTEDIKTLGKNKISLLLPKKNWGKHHKTQWVSPEHHKPTSKGMTYFSPNKLLKSSSDFIFSAKYLVSPGNERKSGETPFKYFKSSRIKTRRKTNTENEFVYKFQVVPKNPSGKSTSKWDTPKAVNYSSKLSSQKFSPNISIFGCKKNSTQSKKITKIVLSPVNRTLLKPRKSKKNNRVFST